MKIRFVYFDCMDTLVQMNIASMEVYPLWAFEGARGLDVWDDYGSFRREWSKQRDRFISRHGSLREGSLLGRVRRMLQAEIEERSLGWDSRRVEAAAIRIYRHYWSCYREASFVLPEVATTLEWLREEKRLTLGVVSNFMVPGGIGDLLSTHGLSHLFAPVVVSCNIGWKKPAEPIYQAALDASGARPEEILFVGDNQLGDYDGPRLFGMRSLLYDPQDEHEEVERRIHSFEELREHLA